MVQCSGCLEERQEKDFYLQSICYRCQYKNKSKKHKVQPKKKCKHCNKELVGYRWVYCSDECATKAKKVANDKYWCRQASGNKVYW